MLNSTINRVFALEVALLITLGASAGAQGKSPPSNDPLLRPMKELSQDGKDILGNEISQLLHCLDVPDYPFLGDCLDELLENCDAWEMGKNSRNRGESGRDSFGQHNMEVISIKFEGRSAVDIAGTVTHELIHQKNAQSAGTLHDPTTNPSLPEDPLSIPGPNNPPKGKTKADENHGNIHCTVAQYLCTLSANNCFISVAILVGCEDIQEVFKKCIDTHLPGMTFPSPPPLFPQEIPPDCDCNEGQTSTPL